jgi:hypothetical protein
MSVVSNSYHKSGKTVDIISTKPVIPRAGLFTGELLVEFDVIG